MVKEKETKCASLGALSEAEKGQKYSETTKEQLAVDCQQERKRGHK
jgi:hypothetical protein